VLIFYQHAFMPLMLTVILLNVIMPIVLMLNIMAPGTVQLTSSQG